MTTTESLLGLHAFLVHNPDDTIRRVWAMRRRGGGPKWHKICYHSQAGNAQKCDWIARMPTDSYWSIRNLDLSMQDITSSARAIEMAQESVTLARSYLDDAIRQGIDPNRIAWEGRNEPQPYEWPYFVSYQLEMIRMANLLNVPRLVLFNFPNGNPGTYGSVPQAAVDWDWLLPVRAAARSGDLYGHHGYCGFDGPLATWGAGGDMKWPVHGGRILHCPWPEKKWLYTEMGCTDAVNGNPDDGYGHMQGTVDELTARYMGWLAFMDTQFILDGRVVGAVIFTDDYEDRVRWASFDTAIPQMSGKLVAHCEQGVTIPSWSAMPLINKWRMLIEYRSPLVGVDAKVVGTVIHAKSKGNVAAIGSGGATGLMQVVDGAHRAGRPSREILLNPDQNLKTGTAILAEHIKAQGDLAKGLAAYGVDADVFRAAWAECWPGVTCPVAGSVVVPPPTTDKLHNALSVEFGTEYQDKRATLPHHATKKFDTRTADKIKRIVIHHSVMPITGTWEQAASYHVNTNGWAGIGYHVGINADGSVAYLGDALTTRAHAYGSNEDSIGVCCMGNYDVDQPGKAMLDSLARVIAIIKEIYSVNIVQGHKDVPANATVCPGRYLYAWLQEPTASEPLPEDEPDGTAAFLAQKVRYWTEEFTRQYESGSTTRADAILYSLIDTQTGLLYRLERKLNGL